MNYLIAGSTGYVGKRLSFLMIKHGYQVYSIERYNELFRLIDKKACQTIVQGTLINVEEAIVALNLTWGGVINLAGNTSKSANLEISKQLCDANITFNACLACIARKIGAERYLYLSTYSVSMDGKSYSPQTLYAATKFASENILEYFGEQENLKIVILHLYDIYGPNHHRAKLVSALIEATMNGKSMEISKGEQEFSPLFVDDACSGIMHALNYRFINRVNRFTLRGKEIFKVKDLPDIISSALNVKLRGNQILLRNDYRKNEIMVISSLYPPLPNWVPKYTFREGVVAITKDIHEA